MIVAISIKYDSGQLFFFDVSAHDKVIVDTRSGDVHGVGPERLLADGVLNGRLKKRIPTKKRRPK